MALPTFFNADIVATRSTALAMIRKAKRIMVWVEVGETTDLFQISKREAIEIIGHFDTVIKV